MEAIAALPAFAEDRVVLHAADGMLDAGPYPTVLRVVRSLACARRRSRPWPLRVVSLPLARTRPTSDLPRLAVSRPRPSNWASRCSTAKLQKLTFKAGDALSAKWRQERVVSGNT
jgi:hypothetical protein